MAVTFKKYESAQGELVSIGSPAKLAGKGGSVRPSSIRNFQDKNKLVAIVITKANGTSAVIPCSKQVSADLRNKDLTLKELVSLPIFECEIKERDDKGDFVYDDNGDVQMVTGHFISYQGSGAGSVEGVKIDDNTIKAPAKTKTANWEELIAFD